MTRLLALSKGNPSGDKGAYVEGYSVTGSGEPVDGWTTILLRRDGVGDGFVSPAGDGVVLFSQEQALCLVWA